MKPAKPRKRPETATRPLTPSNGQPEKPERVRMGVSHRVWKPRAK